MAVKTRRRWRWLQLLTGIHKIHDIRYSFGWKLPFVDWAYFPAMPALRPTFRGWQRVQPTTYHNCTKTGRY